MILMDTAVIRMFVNSLKIIFSLHFWNRETGGKQLLKMREMMKVFLFIVTICLVVLSSYSVIGKEWNTTVIQPIMNYEILPGIEEGRIVFESFEDGFSLWEPDAQMPWDPEKHIPPHWSVILSQEKSHTGQWSLNFTANGLFDDGTVWIVREISLPPGSWDIGLEFYFWSEQSDVNNWQVVSYIGLDRPEVEGDFTVVGYAGIEGWSPYGLQETIVVDEQTTAWVALGYSIVWETWRTHYFDSVTITGLPHCPGQL